MKTLLLVDDSATFRRVVSNMMKERLLVVGQAKDGAEGILMHRELKPDLVILDITMPNVGGRECLQAILKESPGAKVIMLSSLSDGNTVNECLELGAKMFVNKETIRTGPLDQNPDLRDAVDSVLAESAREAA